MRKRLQYANIPVSTLYAVAKQPDEIFVPNTTNCFDFHLELLLGLAPGEAEIKK
jgi:hypothetical protein